MESESNRDAFGDYLKEFRIKQELAIETVAEKTKITVQSLRAIEENAHDRLPPRAYVRSFIRTYADAVGANADVAVDLYLSELEQQEYAEQQKLKSRAKRWAIRRALIAVAVIVGILLLLKYTDRFLDPAVPQNTETPERITLPGPPITGTGTATSRLSTATMQDKLKLQVIAVEQTWLKVIVDGQNARSYNLKPEDRLELEGTNSFNLMIGNATGLRIFLDERPVKIFGSSGQVVSLKIP